MSFLTKTRLQITALAVGATLAGGLVGGAAVAYQGHMFSALHALQVARNQLAMAAPDKAGYRVQAIGLVDQAISAVNAGLSAGAQ